MKEQVLVSIGLPVFNGESWLKEALESIIHQSYQNWELIITDDGSTDSSLSIVEEYLSDSRINVLSDGIHRGISYRINQQVMLAKGVYFARMDADDLMMSDRLRIQVDYMQSHLSCDVCGTAAGKWTFVHPTVMGRTFWFREHPYRSECDGCEDWDLWLRTKNFSSFGFISEPLIYYRTSDFFDKDKYLLRRHQGRLAIQMNKENLSCWKYYYLLLESFAKSIWVIIFK